MGVPRGPYSGLKFLGRMLVELGCKEERKMAKRRRFEAAGRCRECGRPWAVVRGGRVRPSHRAGFCGSACLDARVGRIVVTDPSELAKVEAHVAEIHAR